MFYGKRNSHILFAISISGAENSRQELFDFGYLLKIFPSNSFRTLWYQFWKYKSWRNIFLKIPG